MLNLPFSKPGAFYRGNLHAHSTQSDGTIPPAEVVRRYRERGYDFIALTDHFLWDDRDITDTTQFRDQTFTTILGAELHGPALGNGDMWHIVAAGLPLGFPHRAPNETALDITRRAYKAGAFIGIAHPHWYALTLSDIRPFLPYSHSVEIWNEEKRNLERSDGWHFADALLAEGYRLSGFAADDSHFNHPLGQNVNVFGAWVMVKAEELTPEALVDALKNGRFYSSQGPCFRDIRQHGDVIDIEFSPVEHVIVSGRGALFDVSVGHDLTVMRTSVEKWRKGGYFRVTIIDAAGKRAWSNPIWLHNQPDGGS